MISIKPAKDQNDVIQYALLMSQSEPWITLHINYEKCSLALTGDFNEVYIVTNNNNNFVGFAIVQMKGVLTGYIQTICIHTEYRNKGIGTTIINYCEDAIFKVSPNAFICYSSFNPSAGKLYKKLGYELVGELTNFIISGESEILLRKTIGPKVGFIAK